MLQFNNVSTNVSLSSNQVVIQIINDDVAEPREFFICTLQAGIVDTVQAIFPSQVTIEIRDDDGEYQNSLTYINCAYGSQVNRERALNEGYNNYMRIHARSYVTQSISTSAKELILT